MALTLANCHLAKAGFDTYPCDDTMDIRDCLNPMKGDSISFNAYTEFFTHTQDICFFLQSQVHDYCHFHVCECVFDKLNYYERQGKRQYTPCFHLPICEQFDIVE